MNGTKTWSGRRRIAMVMTVVFAAAIAMGGTYAWQSMNSAAFNPAEGESGPAGGRLHDDYEVMAPEGWVDNITANKDIYVENYESVANGGRDIFARVKLYEYMETGAGAREKPYLEDGSVNPDYALRDAQPLVSGADRGNPESWSPRVPGADIASDQFRARWNWAFGGQKSFMPTFNKDRYSLETDIKGAAVGSGVLPATEPANTTGYGEAYEYATDAGLHDYFETEPAWQAQEKIWDESANGGNGDHSLETTPVEHTAKLTASGSVITMAQWKKSPYNSQKGNYWVIDADGWCYWANPIAPETATGLLLDSITLQGEPDDKWYYCIYVKSQMATGGDWMRDAEGGGFYADPDEQPGPDAENLLNIITDHIPAVSGVYLSQNTAAVNVNGTLNLSAQVTTENTEDEIWKAVTWSITPGVGSRFANGIFSPSATDADKWFTIKAASVKDPAKYAECKVYVPNTDQGVTVGADGNVYLYYIDNDDNTYQKVNPDGTLGSLVCPIEAGKPGADTDRSNVVTINGVHYLDEGDGRHYLAAGSDGKLGTADDMLVYDSGGGIMLPSEDMVNLELSPVSPSMITGGMLNLTVTATFEGNTVDVSGVTWTLIGGPYAAGTTISGSGGSATLAVAVNESAPSVTVRVTHSGNSNMLGTSKDMTVAVNNLIPTGATTFTDTTGVVWRILKDNRPEAGTQTTGGASDGSGTILILGEKVYGTGGLTGFGNSVPYMATNVFAPYTGTTGAARPAANVWYGNHVSPELKAIACIPNLSYEAGDYTPSWSITWNMDSAISTPGSLAGAATDNIVFPLSVSEANRFLPVVNRTGYSVAGSTVFWWLRSPGEGALYRVSYVTTDGTLSGNGTITYDAMTPPIGFRPAMWVDTTP